MKEVVRLKAPSPSLWRAVSQWVAEYGRSTFWSPDFVLGAIAGLVAGGLDGRYTPVQGQAQTLLLGEFALGAALLAVVVTALAILVSLIDTAYLRVLEHSDGGVGSALAPFATTAVLAATTAVVAAIGCLVIPVAQWFGGAAIIGVATLLAVWSTWATLQLAFQIVEHGVERGKLLGGIEDARLALQRRKQAN